MPDRAARNILPSNLYVPLDLSPAEPIVQWPDDDDKPTPVPASVLEAVVDKREVINVLFDYPLKNEHVATFTRTGGWTLEALLRQIAARYREIYEEEDDNNTLPEDRGGLLNRAESNGPHGIWGHDLEDLELEGLSLHPDGIWRLEVGS